MSDYEKIKRELHPVFVMQAMGHVPVERRPGKFIYHSPFRPDSNPSFDVYYNEEQGCWKYGDWAEGTGGDVIDLLGRFGCTLADAWPLIRQQSGWTPPEVPPPLPFQPDTYENADSDLSDALGEHWDHHTPSGGAIDDTPPWLDLGTAEWYNDEWRLKADGHSLVIPYFDSDDNLVACKIRPVEGHKMNTPGSRLCLYGLWRLRDDDRPIILCEGESDTWTAQLVLGAGWTAVGVPGVSHRPSSIGGEKLAGRRVVIAFDGDNAGKEGLGLWLPYLLSAGCDVSVAPVPEGKDLSSLKAAEILEVISAARYPSPRPEGISRVGDRYHTLTRDGNVGKDLSNWALDVQRVLHGDGGELAFEGILLPTRAQVVLPAVALSSAGRIISWSIENGVAWTGGGQDHNKLLALLQHETFALPTGRMTNKVGFHSGDWVWPGGHYGTHDWTYVPPVADIGLSSSFNMSPTDGKNILANMLGYYAPEVITPLMAWLAASFLRPLFKQFPVLYISGTSGTGKTTLIEHVLPQFTGSLIETNLTNTTPHALAAFFGSSTSFPVWFDEYRPGMRPDMKQMFDQMLRDSYNGKRSSKGGQDRSNLSAVTAFDTAVPVLVSGEDSMVETSIVDRTVLLRLTKDRQGELFSHSGSAALSFIRFLSAEAGADLRGGFIQVVPEGPKDLNDRQRWNLGVLRYGWDLIEEYLHPMRLPELDLSLVVGQGQNSSASSPLEDALLWAMDQGLQCVFENEGLIHIQADEFLREVKRADIFTLPVTNTQGVKEFFIDNYGAEAGRVRMSGRQFRTISFPADLIE